MLGDSAAPGIRRVITQKYEPLNAEPRRRDSGCFQRTALVRALRGRATPDDLELLETALWTVEIIGRFDAASELRAAALVTPERRRRCARLIPRGSSVERRPRDVW